MKDQLRQDVQVVRVLRSFQRGLATYHANAEAQAEIARHLADLLGQFLPGSQVGQMFEFGCGSGHLTEALLSGLRPEKLLLNDLVPEAETALQPILQCHRLQVDFRAGPVEQVELPAGLDLIASASTVQWIPELPRLLRRFSDALTPGGIMALSGFGTAQFHELVALGSSAGAPGYLDAEDWSAILPADMELLVVEQRPIVLQFSSLLDLLRHLRMTGVNGQAQERWGRARLRQFEAEYKAQFGQSGQLPLTYDPVWVIAQKRQD